MNVTDKFATSHQFLTVDFLIYPVILGTDFLYKYHMCLDFTSFPVIVLQSESELQSIQPLWDATVEVKAKRYATATIGTALDLDII